MESPVHQLPTLCDAMAWLAGHRFLSRAPMDDWFSHLRCWRNDECLICTLPLGILGHAICAVPLDAIDMTDDELAAAFGPAFNGTEPSFAECESQRST